MRCHGLINQNTTNSFIFRNKCVMTDHPHYSYLFFVLHSKENQVYTLREWISFWKYTTGILNSFHKTGVGVGDCGVTCKSASVEANCSTLLVPMVLKETASRSDMSKRTLAAQWKTTLTEAARVRRAASLMPSSSSDTSPATAVSRPRRSLRPSFRTCSNTCTTTSDQTFRPNKEI